jgi:hypothetical protein
MKLSKNISAVAAGAALIAALAPGLAQADAVAQSILKISGLTFKIGDGAAGAGSPITLGTDLSITQNSLSFDTLAVLNAGADIGVAVAGGKTAKIGPAAGSYAPGTVIAGAPTGTFVGSHSSQTGDALAAGATALTDNTVSLKPTGVGTAQGNVNLNVKYDLHVAAAGSKLEIRFDAEKWLRAYLDIPGVANASMGWTISLKDSTNITIFEWTPNGQAGGIAGGIEYADPFSLTQTISQLGVGNTTVGPSIGSFEAETFALAAGTYTLAINHTGNTNASALPEPGSIALLSVALFGAGFAARRRAKKQE